MTPKEITYREFFAKLDEACTLLTLAVNKIDIAVHELKMVKSSEWGKHYEDGSKEVDNE